MSLSGGTRASSPAVFSITPVCEIVINQPELVNERVLELLSGHISEYLLRKFSTLREHHEKPPVRIQAQCMEILLGKDPIIDKMQTLWKAIHTQNKNAIGPSLFELLRIYGRKPDMVDDSSSSSDISTKTKLALEQVQALVKSNKVILVDDEDFVEEEKTEMPKDASSDRPVEAKHDPIGGSQQPVAVPLTNWQWFYQTYVDPYLVSPVKTRVLNPAIAMYYSSKPDVNKD